MKIQPYQEEDRALLSIPFGFISNYGLPSLPKISTDLELT